MGDPEAEGRFERARELHRRAIQRSLERWRGNETLVAAAKLPVAETVAAEPPPREPAPSSDRH